MFHGVIRRISSPAVAQRHPPKAAHALPRVRAREQSSPFHLPAYFRASYTAVTLAVTLTPPARMPVPALPAAALAVSAVELTS